MITMTFGTFPSSKRVREIGVWDGVFYWDLRGCDELAANIAGLDSEIRVYDIKRLFTAVKKLLRVSRMQEKTIYKKIPNYLRNKYTPEDVIESAISLASGTMLVGVGVEWI